MRKFTAQHNEVVAEIIAKNEGQPKLRLREVHRSLSEQEVRVMPMITGPQLYWIMEIGMVLTEEEALNADGLWDGLGELDKKKFCEKTKLINSCLLKEESQC